MKPIRGFVLLLSIGFIFSKIHAQVPNFLPPYQVQLYDVPAPGYLLLSPFSLTPSNYAGGLIIADSAAQAIAFRPEVNESAPPFSVNFVVDFNLQADSSFSYFVRNSNGDNVAQFLNSELELIDSLRCGNNRTVDEHEVIRETDGTTHLFCLEERRMDISHIFTVNGVPGSDTAIVLGNNIQRLDSNGNVLWEWRSLDHFNLNDTDTSYFTTPDFLDHTHVNSLDIDFDGNYLISSRNLNEITKINSTTGQVIWRFGGKQNDFTLMGDTVPFTGQHDARRRANGHISLFDNATKTLNGVARAIEYRLDTVNMTATVSWQRPLSSGHKSLFIGNNQLLHNGHRLIDWGGVQPFNQTISIEEVDSLGNTVMSIDFPGNFVSYRARKFHLPFNLPRPEITCSNNVLSAPAGLDAYLWSDGTSSQSIIVTDTGTYHVWIKKGDAYFRSVNFIVNDTSNVCGFVGLEKHSKSRVVIAPNPAKDLVKVSLLKGRKIESISLHSLQGNTLPLRMSQNSDNSVLLNVAHLSSGIYILRVNGLSKKLVITGKKTR